MLRRISRVPKVLLRLTLLTKTFFLRLLVITLAVRSRTHVFAFALIVY